MADIGVGCDLAAAVRESDRRFYEIGATLERFEGATLAWLPGLARLPVGAIVQRVDPVALPAILSAIETKLRALGTPIARIYLDEPEAADKLAAAGFTRREESLFAGLVDGVADFEIVEVASEQNWARKSDLHRLAGNALGLPMSAEDWVAFERAKIGGLTSFLALSGHNPVATFCTFDCGPILRLKNLVVRPDAQRHGCATSVLHWATAQALERGKLGVGAVAVAPVDALYRSSGFACVGRQYEWTRVL